VTLYFNPDESAIGSYSTSLIINSDSIYEFSILLKVENNINLQLSDSAITIEAMQGKGMKDSVYIKNMSAESINYAFELEKQWDWLAIENSHLPRLRCVYTTPHSNSADSALHLRA